MRRSAWVLVLSVYTLCLLLAFLVVILVNIDYGDLPNKSVMMPANGLVYPQGVGYHYKR